MTISNMAFDPATGLRDKTIYPTDPLSEDSLRDAVQKGMDQLRDYVNGTLLPKVTDKTGDTMSGNLTVPALIAAGLTGATAASRYVGATASGAPTTGTFAVGDFSIDRSGAIWICITAGTPGTWSKISALVGAITAMSGGTRVQSGVANVNAYSGTTITFPAAFNTTPVVVASSDSGYNNVTPASTGFTLKSGYSGVAAHNWIAIGT